MILCSQKTLPVALSVISFLPEDVGNAGLMALPCIIAHFVQIVCDGVVAAQWSQHVDRDGDVVGDAGSGRSKLGAPPLAATKDEAAESAAALADVEMELETKGKTARL